MTGLADYEISEKDTEDQLFDTDSIASKFFFLFNQNVGKKYLHHILTVFSEYVEKYLSTEPIFSELGLDEFDRKAFLLFLQLLVGTIHVIPPELKIALSIIYRRVQKGFGSLSGFNFLILCFFL